MDPEVVLPVGPIEQGGAQPLLGSEPPARDELPFQDMVRRLHHGVVVRVAGPGDGSLDPEGGQDRVDLGVAELRPADAEWNTSIPVNGNSTFEKEAFTSDASLRRPQEQPTISLLYGSTNRQT